MRASDKILRMEWKTVARERTFLKNWRRNWCVVAMCRWPQANMAGRRPDRRDRQRPDEGMMVSRGRRSPKGPATALVEVGVRVRDRRACVIAVMGRRPPRAWVNHTSDAPPVKVVAPKNWVILATFWMLVGVWGTSRRGQIQLRMDPMSSARRRDPPTPSTRSWRRWEDIDSSPWLNSVARPPQMRSKSAS